MWRRGESEQLACEKEQKERMRGEGGRGESEGEERKVAMVTNTLT